MEIGIKELGITLMVGAFTILGLEAILHYFFNRGFIGFFDGRLGLEAYEQTDKTDGPDAKSKESNRKKPEKEQTMTLAVFIAFAFAVGIVFEDLSYKYVDSQNIPFRTIPAKIFPDSLIHKLDLPTEDDDRVTTLIDSFKNPKPNALALDLARNDAFLISDNSNTGTKVQQWILNERRCIPGTAGDDCPATKEIDDSIKSLYYYAKNTVYADANHYDELRKIQARFEFTRSLSMIAFIYFLIAVVIGTPVFILNRLMRQKSGEPQSRLSELRGRIPVLVAVLVCVYFLSIWAFARESDAFNRRAFGYFSTMLITDKRHQGQRPREQPATENQQGTRSNQGTSQTPQTKP